MAGTPTPQNKPLHGFSLICFGLSLVYLAFGCVSAGYALHKMSQLTPGLPDMPGWALLAGFVVDYLSSVVRTTVVLLGTGLGVELVDQIRWRLLPPDERGADAARYRLRRLVAWARRPVSDPTDNQA